MLESLLGRKHCVSQMDKYRIIYHRSDQMLPARLHHCINLMAALVALLGHSASLVLVP